MLDGDFTKLMADLHKEYDNGLPMVSSECAENGLDDHKGDASTKRKRRNQKSKDVGLNDEETVGDERNESERKEQDADDMRPPRQASTLKRKAKKLKAKKCNLKAKRVHQTENEADQEKEMWQETKPKMTHNDEEDDEGDAWAREYDQLHQQAYDDDEDEGDVWAREYDKLHQETTSQNAKEKEKAPKSKATGKAKPAQQEEEDEEVEDVTEAKPSRHREDGKHTPSESKEAWTHAYEYWMSSDLFKNSQEAKQAWQESEERKALIEKMPPGELKRRKLHR